MRLTISHTNRADLADAISIACKIRVKTIALEVNDGGVYVSASYDGIDARMGIPGSGLEDGRVWVHGGQLKNVIDNLPPGALAISADAKSLRISSYGVDVDLLVSDGPDPWIPTDRRYPECDAEELARTIRSVLFAASDDPTRYNLNTVCLEHDGTAVATNGHRLAMAKTSITTKRTLTIPRAGCLAILSIMQGSEGQIAFGTDDEHHLRVSRGNRHLRIFMRSVQYPTWRKIFAMRDPICVVTVDRRQLEDILRLAMIGGQPMNVSVLEHSLLLIGGESDLVVHGTVAVDAQGYTPTMGVNVRYLLDAIVGCGCCSHVRISMHGEIDPLIIEPAHDNPHDLRCVVMPMRI